MLSCVPQKKQNVLGELKKHWDSIDHPQDLRDRFIQKVESEKADAARAKLSEVRSFVRSFFLL